MEGGEKNEHQMEVATSENPSNKNTPERPKRTTKPVSAAKLLGLAVKPKDCHKIKTPQKRKIKNTDETIFDKSTVDQNSSSAKDEKEANNVSTRGQFSPSSVPAGLLKPFELGWRREIVYRGVQNPAKPTKQCDIYYFTPEKIKLRSLPMIIDYLSRSESELTRECFSFSKQRIYKEPEEIVRDAGKSRNSLNYSLVGLSETSISENDAKTPKNLKSVQKAKTSEKKLQVPKLEEQLQKSEKKRGRKSLALINHENLQDDVKKIFTETPETIKSAENVRKRGRKKRKFSELKSDDDDDSSKTIQKRLKTDEDSGKTVQKRLKIDDSNNTAQMKLKTDDVSDKTVQKNLKADDDSIKTVPKRLKTVEESGKTVQKKSKTEDSSKTAEKKLKTEDSDKTIQKKVNAEENSKPKTKKKFDKNLTLNSETASDKLNATEDGGPNEGTSTDYAKKDVHLNKKKFTEDVVLKTEDGKEGEKHIKTRDEEKQVEKCVVDEKNDGPINDVDGYKKVEKIDSSKGKGKELSTLEENNAEQIGGKNEVESFPDHESSCQEDKSTTEQLNEVTDMSADNIKVKNTELKNKANESTKVQLKTADAKENKKKNGSETSARPVVSSVMCDICMTHLSNKYLNNFNSASKGITCEACRALAKENQFLEYPTFVSKNKKTSDDDLQLGANRPKSEVSARQSTGEEALIENQILSIDPAITSVLDISKKFFLCVEDTKIPVEPSNVYISGQSLNIGLGQCPLPKELVKGNLFPLQFAVESSGDVQMLNVTVLST